MWVFEVGFPAFGVLFLLEAVRRRFRYPTAPCRWCGGTGKAFEPGRGRARWGPCRHCGESGTRVRDGARFLYGLIGRRREQ